MSDAFKDAHQYEKANKKKTSTTNSLLSYLIIIKIIIIIIYMSKLFSTILSVNVFTKESIIYWLWKMFIIQTTPQKVS